MSARVVVPAGSLRWPRVATEKLLRVDLGGYPHTVVAGEAGMAGRRRLATACVA